MIKKSLSAVANWDAKTALALAFFAGYFALIYLAMNTVMTPEQTEIVRDLIGPLTPIVGIVGFAIWKNSRKDNLEAAANAEANVMHAQTANRAVEVAANAEASPVDRDPWEKKS